MQKDFRSLANLTDEQLLKDVKTLAGREREATVQLIASLGELDIRRLYLGEGCSSLFTYCTQCLRLSEHAAYSRIEAARAARKWPVVLEMLEDGSVTLTTVVLVGRHLTTENHLAVLEAAKHRSRREVEQQVAALRPLPPVPSSIRKLPAPVPAVQSPPVSAIPEMLIPQLAVTTVSASLDPVRSTPPPPARRPAVNPLAPDRFKVQIAISGETHDKLRRVQDLLRHSLPSGDPAEIFDRAPTLLLADLERKKVALTHRPQATKNPAPGSRHVPAAVRREVWQRDGARCAFVGAAGRCAERGFLEFHHVVPCALGGEATAANIELRCRAHNAYEAEQFFGSFVLRERPAAIDSVRTEFEGGTTSLPPAAVVPVRSQTRARCEASRIANYRSLERRATDLAQAGHAGVSSSVNAEDVIASDLLLQPLSVKALI